MAVVRNRGKNARNHSFKVWLNAAEAEMLQERVGLHSVSAWLRSAALGKLITTPSRRRKIRCPSDLAPIVIQLAQLNNRLELLSVGRSDELCSAIATIQEEIRDALARLFER